MWTEITRPKYERKGSGYSSDLSDPEWAMIEPRLPQRNRLGRPPKTPDNSSLPPSANPVGAKPPTTEKPTGRKRGAQPGHKGHGRKRLPVEQVDQRVEHRPQQCQACQASLLGVAGRIEFGQLDHLLQPPVELLVRHRRGRRARAVGRGLPGVGQLRKTTAPAAAAAIAMRFVRCGT